MADAILKRCTSCTAFKPIDLFGKDKSRKDGLHCRCKECQNIVTREWRAANPESAHASSLKWQKNNPAKVAVKRKRFLQSNPGYEAERMREWREKNPERAKLIDDQCRRRRQADPTYKLHNTIANGLRDNLKAKRRGSRTFEILGYGLDDLMAHIERQFLKGMHWGNFGEWHIDHVQPLASFSIIDQDDPELRVAWGLPNLRPLWAVDNLKKNAKRIFLV